MTENLNVKFDIPLEGLEDRIHCAINGDFSGYDRIIPLRDLASVRSMAFFKKSVFEQLIRNVTVRSTDHRLYANSEIETYGREPKGFNVGQTFVLQSKILGIMENLEGRLFSSFVAKGLSKMPPTIVYGTDSMNRKAIAFYIPPIIEIHPGNNVALIDGAHRSYIIRSAGTTVNGVHITNPDADLPFDIVGWKDVKLVQEKPAVEQRYVNLRRELFRDLSYVGIDG